MLRTATLVATISFSLLSCSSAHPPETTGVEASVRAISVAPPHYDGAPGEALQDVCEAWHLSAQQVERFFQLSEAHQSNPYSGFYQIPCSVSGELQAEGRTWVFEINGGATATWRAEGETRYWGCRDEECGPLVLMPTDSMSPDDLSP
ncbi:MAG: hypothetical protein ACREPV_03340 [Lysobacter sp.]